MAKLDVEVLGVSKTITKMTQYNITLYNQVDKLNRVAAKAIVVSARSKVPVLTGGLKKSIKAKYFTKNAGPAATVFPRGRAGSARHLIEYGTKQRSKKNGANTGSVKATPFMKPAASSESTTYESAVKGVLFKDVTI